MDSTSGAARAARALPLGQQKALLQLANGATHIRRDVVAKLRERQLVCDEPSRQLTEAGRVLADELRVMMRRHEPAPIPPVDVVAALTAVDHRAAPVGVPGAIGRMLFDLKGDAERVQALAWLADHQGAAYLGALKDAMIVAAKRGRTHEGAANHLGISTRAVNRATTRFNAARQSEVDNPTRLGG